MKRFFFLLFCISHLTLQAQDHQRFIDDLITEGTALYERKQYDSTILVFTQVLELNKKHQTDYRTRESSGYLAITYYNQEKYHLAIQIHQSSLNHYQLAKSNHEKL